MNDFYLEILNDDIFWESMDSTLSSIDMNDEIITMLEDGESNSKQANIIMRVVDAIMRKIREIIDWIKGISSNKNEQTYADFLKQLESRARDIRIEFDKDPSYAYTQYVDIFKIISKNYDKSGSNDNKDWFSDIDDILSREPKNSELTISDCLKLSTKFKDLSNNYKNLSDKAYNIIRTKSKNGVDTKDERRVLTIIGKIETDIKKRMMMLTPSVLSKKGSIKEKLKLVLGDPRTPGKLAQLALSLGIIAASAIYKKTSDAITKKKRFDDAISDVMDNRIENDMLLNKVKGGYNVRDADVKKKHGRLDEVYIKYQNSDGDNKYNKYSRKDYKEKYKGNDLWQIY